MALEENNEEYMQKLSATHFAEQKAVHNTYCSISIAKKVDAIFSDLPEAENTREWNRKWPDPVSFSFDLGIIDVPWLE